MWQQSSFKIQKWIIDELTNTILEIGLTELYKIRSVDWWKKLNYAWDLVFPHKSVGKTKTIIATTECDCQIIVVSIAAPTKKNAAKLNE